MAQSREFSAAGLTSDCASRGPVLDPSGPTRPDVPAVRVSSMSVGMQQSRPLPEKWDETELYA